MDKAAEFYGFYNMLGKFAAVIGPAMLGSVTVLTGNVRYGLVSLLILFISSSSRETGSLPAWTSPKGNGSPGRS